MKEIRFCNSRNVREALSNILFHNRCDEFTLKHKLLNTTTAETFWETAVNCTGLYWTIDDETNKEVVLLWVDPWGNKKYLTGIK